MKSWKSCVVGHMERGATFVYEGFNEAVGPQKDSHLSWGLLFVEFPKMSPELFSEITSKYDVIDTVDERTMIIKLFKQHVLINPGCTPAVYSQAEVLKPPTGDWWHLPSMAHRAVAYPICDLLHNKYNAVLYWIIDVYPLKLAAVMTLTDFAQLAADQRPQEYGHQHKQPENPKTKSKERDASPERKSTQ
jgi:hypothetical protein